MALRGSRLGEARPLRIPGVSVRHPGGPSWGLYASIVAVIAAIAFGVYVQRVTNPKTHQSTVAVVTTGPATPVQQTTPTVPEKTNTPAPTNQATTLPATGVSTSKTQGTATNNGCGILDPKYCSTGKIVQYDGKTYIGFDFPIGSKVFSPFDNVVTFGVGVGLPGHLLQGVVVLKGNNINTSPGFVAVGNGLVYLQTSSFNKSGNAVNPHVFGKGDVVTTLQTDDRVPGLSDNVLIRFASPDKTIDALFASEVAKVQSGQETVDQLIQNMVEAVQGFTNK